MSQPSAFFAKAYRLFEFLHDDPTETHFLGILYKSDVPFKEFQKQLKTSPKLDSKEEFQTRLLALAEEVEKEEELKEAFNLIDSFIQEECEYSLSKALGESRVRGQEQKGEARAELYSKSRKIKLTTGILLITRGSWALVMGVLLALFVIADLSFYLSYYFYDAPALKNPPVPVRVEVMQNIVHYENKSNPNWNVIECVIQYNIAGVIYEQSNISKMRLETGLKYDATFPRGRPDLARIKGTELIDREYSHQLLIYFAATLIALLWVTISRIYFIVSLKLGSFELHKLEKRPQKVQEPGDDLWDILIKSFLKLDRYSYKSKKLYPSRLNKPVEWTGGEPSKVIEFEDHIIVHRFRTRLTAVKDFPLELFPDCGYLRPQKSASAIMKSTLYLLAGFLLYYPLFFMIF